MAAWWRRFVAVAVLVGVAPAAWGADIRVGFIDPEDPPPFWNLIDTTMRAAAAELGIDVDIRGAGRSRDKAIALAKNFLGENPPLDYLITSNNLNVGGEIIKLVDAAHVKMIFLNGDLPQKGWAEYGEPRTKYPNWLGSINPGPGGAGYGIGAAVLTEAARLKTNRPLKVLALAGDSETLPSVERVRGLKRAIDVMTKLLGLGSVELVDV